MVPDADTCYRAVASRDSRFDGWFITGVTTTGIYCRPSCPTPIRPKRENVRFFATAAAAQGAGFRACKRCRPDATPGAPGWDVRGDLVARAMRLIADGVVDREGVGGVATRLGVSDRHLHRLLVGEVGAGPLALARAQRAQTARTLIETTDLRLADVAFSAGFASVRQFNDTVREVFAVPPRQLRESARRRDRRPVGGDNGVVSLRLPFRPPYDAAGVLRFLAGRATTGVEHVTADGYERSLRLPHGPAVVRLEPQPDHVRCTLHVASVADVSVAVARIRRLLDLDADPVAVADVLGRDAALAPLVAAEPGRRSPGAADGAELAVRAILGQQVSVAAATALAGRIAAAHGEVLPAPLAAASGAVTHLFPEPAALAAVDPATLPMPAARARAVVALAAALAAGDITLDAGADRQETEARLQSLPGIGPWTASYISMRALRDPDAFPASDLALRSAATAAGIDAAPAALAARAERWRPWRAYATHHLWASLAPTPGGTR